MDAIEGKNPCTDTVQHGVPKETLKGIKAYLNMFFKIGQDKQTSRQTFTHSQMHHLSAPQWTMLETRLQYSHFF